MQFSRRQLTLESSQFSHADNGESGQVVGYFLQVGLITGLYPTLIQGVVIAEHEKKQVE